MKDVVFAGKAMPIDSLAVYKSAVGAVFVAESEFPADISGEYGVRTAQRDIVNDQVVLEPASYSTRKRLDVETDERTI